MDNDGAATIGDRIRFARKLAGLNQASLAERVGVSQPAVANWESGLHDPRRLMIARLAGALKVSQEWLESGARSTVEKDRQPAAAYIRRPIQHAPVISFRDAARILEDVDFDPHTVAGDYIPVTARSSSLFALFITDDAVDLVFPRNSLVVIDYADKTPTDGVFCLAAVEERDKGNLPILRCWRDGPSRLESCSSIDGLAAIAFNERTRIIGCARVSIRFH